MSVLSQEPSQPPSYWRYHPGPHLLQGNTGQEAPVQVLCCIPKGSTAHHSLHFSSIYYKRRKLQLLSVVATSGFDKIFLFCFLQLTGKPGAGKPQLPFPFPFLHALQGTVCSRQSWKSNWLPFALLNVPRDLRNPPSLGFYCWTETSSYSRWLVRLLSQCHDMLRSSGRKKLSSDDGKLCKWFPLWYIAESSAYRYHICPVWKLYGH